VRDFKIVVDRVEFVKNVLELVSQWDDMTPTEHEALVERFAELLQPSGYRAARIPLYQVLREAAQRAGWHLPSPKIQQRQRAAARGRTNQREEDVALRRIFVSQLYKELPARLRKKPSSTATAQAIISRLEDFSWKEEGPPITKLGRRILYRRSSLQAWLRARERHGHK
jgi:hypothetical protein